MNCSTGDLDSKDMPINEQREPELRPGFYGIGDGRERGKRPRIGIS